MLRQCQCLHRRLHSRLRLSLTRRFLHPANRLPAGHRRTGHSALHMPSEVIGTCGNAQWPDREMIVIELEFGIACLRKRCGPEPPGTSLELVWQDHDCGAYATIRLVWGQGSLSDKHWKYIQRCGDTLDKLESYLDWSAFSPPSHIPRAWVAGESDDGCPAG